MPEPEAPLSLPPQWVKPLADRGWEYRAANAGYVFLQRPGYWLRLTYPGKWEATVMPEDSHVPDGVTWPPPQFAQDELAPAITGRGARAKALEQARALWSEHAGYLEELGIELWAVGVRQNRSTGGSGSSVGTRTYLRQEVS